MSRVGKAPITVPANVTVTVEPGLVKVKGPKGELFRNVNKDMLVTLDGGKLTVQRPSEGREHKALHGLTRTLIANMVEGVTNGYTKTLELSGTGYRAAKSGQKLTLSVGFSHPVEVIPPAGIDIEVPSVTMIVVKGIDKELVGQIAANVRAVKPPEPYLGKGIKYQGEKVRRKVGKTGKK